MKTTNRAWAALVMAVLLVLAGCSERTDGDQMAAARSHIANRDSAAAILELKTLLGNNPQSGEARFLLGKLLLEGGDAAGAEAELRRALEAGHPENDAVPLLATAMVAQQKSALLVAQYGRVELNDDQAAGVLKTQLATAHLAGGAVDEADAAVSIALQRSPDHTPALLLRARLKALRGDLAAARADADALLARAPDNAAAWMLKGDLLRQGGSANEPAAIEAYRQALSLQPDLLQAHSALLSLLIAQGDFAAANRQFEALKKALPQHAETLFFEALLALQRGDARRTREITQALMRVAPNDPNLLLMAGQAELQLNSLVQADAFMGKLVQAAPKAAAPRRLLATVQLRAGQPDKALATLKPLLEAGLQDPQVLALAGQAQLLTGDSRGADLTFARALKLKPDDAAIRTSMALMRLGKGQPAEAGLDELARVAKTDAGITADLALISARLNRREFDAALKALDTLATKQPGLALPDYLRGRIALQRNEPAAARKSFEAALAKEATFYPAVAELAEQDMRDGKPEQARARFEALLVREPSNVAARLAVAELSARMGGGKLDVAKKLEDAVRADPGATVTRVALIDHHLATGEARSALVAAQAALAVLPDNFDLLDRLGRALMFSGDVNQAVSTFNKMATMQPKSLLPQLRLVEAHLARYDASAAGVAAQRAMALAPESLAAQQAGIAVAMRENRPAQALAIARNVQAQRPGEAAGFLLEGEIELSQQRFDAAGAAFRKALGKTGSNQAASKYYSSLARAQKSAEADRFAAEWVKDHPDDMAFVFDLGSIALDRQDDALAETRFREVLNRLPDNASAMNNLAMALIRQKKPGALPLAERAAGLAPYQASMHDTLAMAFALDTQLDKAILAQSRAVELAPLNDTMRLTLAKLKLQAGDKDGARAELDRLAALGMAYPGQDEVQRLRKSNSMQPAGNVSAASPAVTASDSHRWLNPQSAVRAAVSLIILVLLLLLIAATRAPLFKAQRSITIDAPAQRVFDLLQDLRAWERWSAWQPFKPGMNRSYPRSSAGWGAGCTWRNKRRSAEGSLEIVHFSPPGRVAIEMTTSRPAESRQMSDFLVSTDPSGATLVSAVVQGEATFRMRFAHVLRGVDRGMGRALEVDLARLKAAAEGAPAEAPMAAGADPVPARG